MDAEAAAGDGEVAELLVMVTAMIGDLRAQVHELHEEAEDLNARLAQAPRRAPSTGRLDL